MKPSRTRQWMVALLGLLMAVSLSAPNATASHAAWAHNAAIHSVSDMEWVCVDTKNSAADQSTILDKVRDTLLYDKPTGGYVWDGIGHVPSSGYPYYKIYFGFQYGHCSDLTNLSSMRMRVYVKTNTPECGGVSCVGHYGQINGGQDYTYAVVTFKEAHVTGTQFLHHHVINHEFGHTLGLEDPSAYGSNCGQSIMHSAYYGCTDYEYVQASDHSSVTSIANTNH